MKNGLYSAEFKTPFGEGFGVVTAINGELTGGDSSMFYVGTYTVSGDQFTGVVNTGRHHAGLKSVFGTDRVTIQLHGKINGDMIEVSGSASQAANVQFSAKLQLIAVGA